MKQGYETLSKHLFSGRFLAGAERGRWRLVDFKWPQVFIELFDRDGHAVCIRFECTGYPERPPQGTPWDYQADQQLAFHFWPRGGRVSQVFNPGWKAGAALYIPCDRESIEGHGNWYTEYPQLIWKPAFGLLQYIEAIYEVLQSHELLPT